MGRGRHQDREGNQGKVECQESRDLLNSATHGIFRLHAQWFKRISYIGI